MYGTNRNIHWDNGDLQKCGTDLSRGARERLKWFLYAEKNGHNPEKIARRFGVSISTVRRWAKRFDPQDLSTLEERSKRPHVLRESDVEQHVIDLIRTYRKKLPTWGKNSITHALKKEHGITISTSTVGRIIQRERFYFADTISHRKKLRSSILSLLIVAGAVLGTLFGVPSVHAEGMTSSSFQLTTNFTNSATEKPQTSDAFQLRGELTWKQKPLSSSSFQITTDPPVAAAISEEEPTQEGEERPAGGGRRFIPPIGFLPKEPFKPAAPVLPEEPEDVPSVPAPRREREKLERGIVELQEDIEKIPTCPAVLESKERIVYVPVISTAPMERMSILWILPFVIGLIVGLILNRCTCRCTCEKSKNKNKKKKAFALITFFLFFTVSSAQAATTGPQKHVYNGHLLDSSGTAITTEHKIRFSYWTSADYVSTDVTSTGSINTSAANYADWEEEHTVTPDSNGYFSVHLGSGTTLPDLANYSLADMESLHLQVEVKLSSAANTAYELLDTDSNSTTIDRSPILAVPFALEADMLDQRHVGTGSGSIPVLGSGGLVSESMIGTGTLLKEWVIDADNSETSSVDLVFGGVLNKILSYNIGNAYFNFNDDVNIQGDLTVTGLVNGIDIGTLGTFTGSHLRVSSGGGLNLKVTAGAYSLSGTIVDFAGDSGISLTDNTTNYVFIGSGGMTVNTSGFPTDESFIRLAEVVTETGGVKTVTDRRVLNSDNREHTVEKDYHPEFEHAVYQGDATNNVGQLSVDHDNTNLHNFYIWESSRSTLQDYDIVLRATLSAEFVRWSTGSLVVNYRSTSASSDDNQMDISVFDTNGSPVTITGDSTNFASTSWATTTLNFGGSPTWTAGQDFLIKFIMHAKDDKQMHLGGVTIKYVDFQQH
ncbi:hypothetical protein A3D11_01075 [Candidatus Peribacteria bacterium RIFCSPHIGHO2_02_FULL_49_16]|uniref:FHA domain-containing protein n=1 Tax=Candidatus Kaiserbacteria bacterium RIFCSPHIGHO2_01_FULL_53_29 TaxID=1798480 RepID=A0A1F6CYZ2_9BACT|nr:MAG: hypothetical protein A2851_05835 [Candidatus Kaiserbacteria bacterium RIFCSPHIGHO2_01_FULL_53_29]OGJ59292.1 MAG: hypothetical protein A3D11_01075 [Candidatus Peribacteria bacterium RIFCSPHIGHO2_02_FULL_49_16]